MARRHIETDIEIEAASARIWAILMDFAAMPGWNPFIKAIAGDPTPGSRLTVVVAPPGKVAMRFKPTVITVRPERELRWLGQLIVPGIFDGEHYFHLEPIGDSRTHFVQGELFSGCLLPFLGGAVSATEAGFQAMNVALKQRAEHGVAGPHDRP
jgi:hypothetical protein